MIGLDIDIFALNYIMLYQYVDMLCPYCREEGNEVVNSRPTFHNSSVWRRRRCSVCHKVFTTYERCDLSFITILKKNGRKQRYSRAKLFSSIYRATISIPNKEATVELYTDSIEQIILNKKLKTLTSLEVGEIVLNYLKDVNTISFIRFLAYNSKPKNINDVAKSISKYIN